MVRRLGKIQPTDRQLAALLRACLGTDDTSKIKDLSKLTPSEKRAIAGIDIQEVIKKAQRRQ